MFKQLWASIAALKTPERRLLFGLMLAIIIVLWLAFRDNLKNNDSAKDIRIETLQKVIREEKQEKETQRILMQDKNDQLQEKLDHCNEEKYKDLKDMLERSEKLKNSIRNPNQ